MSLRKKVEALDTEWFKGAMVVARLKRLSIGEIPKKQALGIETTYASKNGISEILYHGAVTSDREINEWAFVYYYEELFFFFRAVNKDGFQTNFLPLMPKLQDNVRKILEQPI